MVAFWDRALYGNGHSSPDRREASYTNPDRRDPPATPAVLSSDAMLGQGVSALGMPGAGMTWAHLRSHRHDKVFLACSRPSLSPVLAAPACLDLMQTAAVLVNSQAATASMVSDLKNLNTNGFFFYNTDLSNLG